MKKIKKDVAFKRNAEEGGIPEAVRTKKITANDPGFEKQMKAADNLIKRYRKTLRELAK